ncbi:MAG: Eco57I restriction-modification methylase domain-containing protein, partial [Thermotogota bacterium]
MEQKIKELSLKIKKIIKEDIENSMEILGLSPYEEAFYIEDLVSKENFKHLSKKIKTRYDYIEIQKDTVFNYYNAIISLKIVNEKSSLDMENMSFEEQIELASKEINFFNNFKNKFLIKLNNETYDEIEEFLNYYDFWNKDDLMGWFYQFYNSDQKDMLTKSQIFTPEWVVKYMVDNSFELIENPLNIKILDPACGSGNFLVYIYDKLKDLYISEGFSLDESIKNILEKNLHGIDIDERALQIAEFSLTLKALEDGYKNNIKFNLSSPDKNIEEERLLGSLLPDEKVNKTKDKFHEILSKKYDLIIANPPYTDSSEYSDDLKVYIKKYYDSYKKNLYTCFIAKNESMVKKNGVITMITPQTFMFISSYEETRKLILNKLNIERFVHFGLGGVFNYALVDTALYILTKKNIKKSKFINLTNIDKKDSKRNSLLNLNKHSDIIYDIDQKIFKNIPGEKFVYWLKKDFYKIFKQTTLEEYCDIRQGIATGNNKKFLRYNWEIPKGKINFEGKESNKRWVPYVKGGPHRKWFGNYYWLISYDEKSKKELQKIGNHLPSKQFYFREGITYTMTTSKGSTFRYLPKNMMFDCKGSAIFPKNNNHIFFFLGLLNSKLTTYILKFLAGSVDLEVGDLKQLPIPKLNKKNKLRDKIIRQSKRIYELKKQNMEIFPEELYNYSFIKTLYGDHFEDMFNSFIKKKFKVDYQILIEESKLNDMVLEIYELTDQKKAFKKEFKDYVDIYKKDESQLKLNYDINKFKTKL